MRLRLGTREGGQLFCSFSEFFFSFFFFFFHQYWVWEGQVRTVRGFPDADQASRASRIGIRAECSAGSRGESGRACAMVIGPVVVSSMGLVL